MDEERRKIVPLAEGELFQTIAAFQLAGYFIWNEEDVSADEAKLVSMLTEASAFESHLLYIGSVRLMAGHEIFILGIWVQFPYRLQWFVGVMINISDCRSAETGLIPVRTAGLQYMR